MTRHRHALAQVCLFTSLLGGCALAHGRDDGGTPVDAAPFDAAPRDAGPMDAAPDGRVPDAAPPDAGLDGGLDGGPVDSGPTDAGVPSCDPQDAYEELCNDVVCDALDRWYWDGASCYPVACGTCTGDDCGDGFESREACEALHSGCASRLCADTGGEWRWWDEVCGHYVCGFEPPAICEVGGPACDCGPDQTFDPVMGCVVIGCPDVDIDHEVLCSTTGGSWENICCDTVCGESCPLPCAAPACRCGADEVFHPLRGCERGIECMERAVGQSCTPAARCEAGSLCCDSCGGAGCAGNPTCRLPTCAVGVDVCGYDPDAP